MILRNGLPNSLMEWKPDSERLLHARFKWTQVNMSILQCYAPTPNAEDEEKENLYSSLHAEVEKISRHDLSIIVEDLNAKVA